ncbi:hypothetical protein HFK18_20815|uniref:hypothetical protein n=1 Tax=Stenotrophomonas sp. SbOxS2 TaxID=2723885 RepID=UPI0015D33EF3|nr:hypothetical protein [Stenotrophomonas sp. SbOxS2]NYU00911.1 hypothetical protein [Stenotrophomonas sp. SbOxS2]
MPYAEHVNVANLQTLIDLVVQFAAANGWTVERNTLTSSSRTATLRIPNVSDYVHLFNNDQVNLCSRISIGYNAGAAPSAQPNVSQRDGMSNVLPGPYPRLKLFSNGYAIHVAVATATAGEYRHHAFGVLEKAGNYVGGTYADGTYWQTLTSYGSGMMSANYNNVVLFGYGYQNTGRGHVRADSSEDARTNSFHQINNYLSGSLGVEGTACTGVGSIAQSTSNMLSQDMLWLGRALGGADENNFSGRSVFHPITISVRRTGTGQYLSPIGQVSGLRACYLEKLEPEQEVTIGQETWVVFPWLRKYPMSTDPNAPHASGNYGWAVRKS